MHIYIYIYVYIYIYEYMDPYSVPQKPNYVPPKP